MDPQASLLLDIIPPEILSVICGFLSPLDVASVSRACHHTFFRVAWKSEYVWHQIALPLGLANPEGKSCALPLWWTAAKTCTWRPILFIQARRELVGRLETFLNRAVPLFLGKPLSALRFAFGTDSPLGHELGRWILNIPDRLTLDRTFIGIKISEDASNIVIVAMTTSADVSKHCRYLAVDAKLVTDLRYSNLFWEFCNAGACGAILSEMPFGAPPSQPLPVDIEAMVIDGLFINDSTNISALRSAASQACAALAKIRCSMSYETIRSEVGPTVTLTPSRGKKGLPCIAAFSAQAGGPELLSRTVFQNPAKPNEISGFCELLAAREAFVSKLRPTRRLSEAVTAAFSKLSCPKSPEAVNQAIQVFDATPCII
ncbi:hypothetical protein PAPYR_10309 [Paratrimastix pyriformis]|uniref:F-box domain-containing protein n=1 Tax=Paratrimastix pyriformis TaxID=342808 RepID=A0ABQ8UB64_9EUKA|nr:hypothetical protein PAPYR_10309 [Paratrimastix pyriformis]